MILHFTPELRLGGRNDNDKIRARIFSRYHRLTFECKRFALGRVQFFRKWLTPALPTGRCLGWRKDA